ncbi:MAG: sensor histidine kinase [Bdellovibrionota bacterium]
MKFFQKTQELEARIDALTTERDQQALLLGAISDAVIAVDLEGAPLFYNSRFALLFGEADIQHRRVWKIFLDREILNGFQLALKEGKSTSLAAIPFEMPAGKQFYSVSISSLKKTADSPPYGAVGIFHDVTELKRAEQIRIDFVANVSHELRTPLTAIKGYADTLISDLTEARPVAREFLEVIVRNTDRLMSLIHDLLDLSTIESTDVLHKSVIGTSEVTHQVLNQLRGKFEARHHRVEVDAQTPTVHADPRRLEQVLVNLLDNANKYTPPGGSITVRWRETSNQNVRLEISDTGPGIAPDHQARLFERFYRIDKARSRELGGTGLGLAIVKHILQRHDGLVWVKSQPGEGTTFVCQFPPN